MSTKTGFSNNSNDDVYDSIKPEYVKNNSPSTSLSNSPKSDVSDLPKVFTNNLDDSTEEEIEEILRPSKVKRLTILPVEYPELWAMYKKHKAAFWDETEIDYSRDLPHWESLNKDEKHFIKYVLAFFASSDLIVGENLASRFQNEVQLIEVKTFYAFQAMMENIHSETYALLILKYITDSAEQKFIMNAVNNIDCIKKKAVWAFKWIESSKSFAERLVAFAAIEGIFFSGSFCCIYWIRERGILPGLCKSNDFIARDEGIHTDFACLLYSKYIKRHLTQERINEIIDEAVQLEIHFITEALPCRLIGMNDVNMKEYIKFVADRLLKQLGHKPLYNAKQPFPFMERIALSNKCNFFESDASEYSRANHDAEDEDAYGTL